MAAKCAASSIARSATFSTCSFQTTMACPRTAQSSCRITITRASSNSTSPAARGLSQKRHVIDRYINGFDVQPIIPAMRTLRFGRTNAQVPAISLGTWGHGGPNTSDGVSVGWTGHDDRLAKEALIEAWRRGITHWDTADAYGRGHAEQLIGEVFAGAV